MGFINTALSGMNAASQDLEVIGNNIANSNTVGFKASKALFADVYTGAAFGGGNVVGSGVSTRLRQDFATGTLTPTNNALDLAINGPGFFVLSDNGAVKYTRNGQFKLDSSNHIVNSYGQKLQGRVNGQAGDLTISQSNINPNATTSIQAGFNFNSQIGQISTPPSANDIPFISQGWAGGATPSTATYNNTTTATIYDSLGNSHVLSMYFMKADDSGASPAPHENDGTSNTWYAAFTIDGKDVDPAAVAPGNNSGKLYSVTYNSDGSYNSVVAPGGAAPATPNKVPISFALTNGANPLSFNVDFSTSTQFGSPFAVTSIQQDGYTTGTLSGLAIDAAGNISGRYTNGQTPLIGTIDIATFPDTQGLEILGNNTWGSTFASGQPLISPGGAGGAGTVASGATEDSNVDLTASLVNLIGAQRAFQANAQTIKSGDTLIQTILNSL